jgi:hypothetical protein
LDHIAFRAQSLGDFLQKLKDHRIEYRRASIPEIGLEQIYVKDSNGVMIELNFRQ